MTVSNYFAFIMKYNSEKKVVKPWGRFVSRGNRTVDLQLAEGRESPAATVSRN
jgi:hypothetical protein